MTRPKHPGRLLSTACSRYAQQPFGTALRGKGNYRVAATEGCSKRQFEAMQTCCPDGESLSSHPGCTETIASSGRRLHLLAWEMTRACTFACPHCRAEACSERHPDELTTAEGLRLFGEAADVGPGIIIFSGGEPLLRPDLEELTAAAGKLGHVPVVATNDGVLLDDDRIDSLIHAGVRRFSFSVHFPDEASADSFTCRRGSFAATTAALARLKTHGMSFQINTTVMPGNHTRLPEMREWALTHGASSWHLFFVVPTGRARTTRSTVTLNQDQIENVLTWAATRADEPGLPIKVTCAPQYARIRAQAGLARSLFGRSCMAGDGFAFVSWQGEVKPCGYFDLIVGNVRTQSFADLYRHAPAFQTLRSPYLLEGACGCCTYREACGGCRARAQALHGSMLGSDPNCCFAGDMRAKFPRE